ncbi:MAG TPA: zinc ribbon domain-containing protein [Thermoanaerobaculia bacterium]|nr:zinc ribbon domain-containing protein [Thermoanaerobaculia bacterium]
MAAGRPNFYLLLELDPGIEDAAAIDRRIEEKRLEWSRQAMGNPKAQLAAKANLALLPELRGALLDPRKRAAEAQAARQLAEAARKKLLSELDEAIHLLRASGDGWDDAFVAKLTKELAPLSRGEIEKRLVAAGVRRASERSSEEGKRPARLKLEPALAKKVRENLDHLGLTSLYELLELRAQSSPQALVARADEKYRESLNRPTPTPRDTAVNALAGLARQVFADDEKKARYDATLAVEAMEPLKPRLEEAGRDGRLGREEVDALLQLARKRGVSSEDALAYVEDYAATRKWRVARDASPLPAETLQLCGFCSALAAAGAQRCPECGKPLVLPCPRCHAANPSSAAACQGCGARVGDAPLVASLLEEAESLLLDGALAAAVDRCDRALQLWPEWQSALAVRERVQARRQEREAALLAIEKLVAERRLAAAQTALGRFQRNLGRAGTERLSRQIEEGLARAQNLVAEAEKLRASGADAAGVLARLDQALAACADFEPALRAAAATPPPPPTDLSVSVLTNGLRLTWRAGAGADPQRQRYRVLRKRGGIPHGPEDGEVVAEVAAQALDDPGATVGVPWCYAVYAVRSGATSQGAAVSGPHLRLGEVAGLEAEAGDGSVRLGWQPPPGCLRVEVRRLRSAPPGGNEGAVLVPVTASGALDGGLTNGETYRYRVTSVFADPARPGGELASGGLVVSVSPTAPPAPVRDLVVERQGDRVRLRWSPVAGAQVEIRLVAGSGGAPPEGTVTPVAALARLGERLATAGGSALEATLPGPGRFQLVPISLHAGTAVVGKAVEVLNLEGATRLAARRVGNGLALTWDWPRGAEAAVVAWAEDGPPQDPRGGGGRRVRVTRAEYGSADCHLIPYLERRRHYFAVFIAVPGQDLYAPPATVLDSGGQETVARYQVETRRGLLSRTVTDAWIEVACTDGLGALPSLLVVAKPQAVPVSASDGEVVARLDALPLEAGHGRIPVPSGLWPKRPYLKLFFQDPEHARSIRLLPAAKDQLRVR